MRWVVERLRDRWPGDVEVAFGGSEAAEAAVVRLDSSRARAVLGWAPPWDLAAGVEATVDWYARRHDGEDARALCEAQVQAFSEGGGGPRDRPAPSAPA